MFARLISAATRLHPRPDGGFFDPEQVHSWLATLARHLADEAHAGRSGTDLFLHEPPARACPAT